MNMNKTISVGSCQLVECEQGRAVVLILFVLVGGVVRQACGDFHRHMAVIFTDQQRRLSFL